MNEIGTVTDSMMLLASTEKTSEVDSDEYLRDSALITSNFPSKKQSFANNNDLFKINVKVSPKNSIEVAPLIDLNHSKIRVGNNEENIMTLSKRGTDLNVVEPDKMTKTTTSQRRKINVNGGSMKRELDRHNKKRLID